MALSRLAMALTAGVLAAAPVATASDAPGGGGPIGYICGSELGRPAGDGPRVLRMAPGIGTGGFTVDTKAPEAQRWFNYGMALAHAFYHQDATAAFVKAREIDPDCAMCAWGEAWSRGQTINFDIDPDEAKTALAMAEKAEALAGADLAPKDAGLIAALKIRYAQHDAAGNGDVAYAKAMDALATRFPADSELQILAADAWLTPFSLHKLAPEGIKRAMALLEPVLKREPDNTGAIHFYIHAAEWAGQSVKAEPYADRLGRLAPSASHLVHMASHTFFAVGRYEDAAVANAQAIGVDGAYLRLVNDTGPLGKARYHGHNLMFGLGGALAAGDGPLALRFAQHALFAYPAAARSNPFAQFIFGEAYTATGRFDPAAAFALPEPAEGQVYARAMRHYARGEAFAARGDAAGVRAEAAQVVLSKGALASWGDFAVGGEATIEVARYVLLGRAGMLDGHLDDAIAALEAAAKLQDEKLSGPDNADPPPFWSPARGSLAAALLQDGQTRLAAVEARKALKVWPHEPLALETLARAEEALGERAAARRDHAEARRGYRTDPAKVRIALL